MSSKDLEWRANIHGAKKHEAGEDKEGRGLLWMDSKLAHALQVLTIDNFRTIVFRVGLESYFIIATIGMKWSTR
jgi:hypothetical protein